MRKVKILIAAFTAAALTATGCGASSGNGGNDSSAEVSESVMESQVASEDEMLEPEEVVEEGMKPISAEQIKDGTYDVTVDSSSSMFNITECELTVQNGEMTAVMTMGGTGYLYVYMGTGMEAVKASEDAYISFEEKSTGEHSFTVPVEALDEGIACAAFSKSKEKWYDRTLCFRADSMPLDAFEDGVLTSVDSLHLEDGEYTVDVALEGGSGKASVDSPAKLLVADGEVTAEITWSSPNYDYMLIDGEKYTPVNTEGNSVFQIPVTVFDWKMAVVADTTAMSTPYEIDYTLYFDSSTIEKVK